MKKTMIAMAVAGVVAAPMASADVSISGVVEQTFMNDDASTTGWTSETFNMLNFNASEDLGNGMTAFAKWGFLDTDGVTGDGMNGGDATVGLKGDFGTVVFGTMEDFTEGKAMSRMSMNGPAGIEAGNANATRTAGGMAYVSPTISGLTFGVAGFAGQSTTGTENLDATDVMIHYVNGPLDIIVTSETQDKDGSLTTSSDDDQTTTVLGISYAFGDLKVGLLTVDEDNSEAVASDDSEDVMVRADYTMGNNTFSIGHLNNESSTAAGVKSDIDITTVEIKHAFSARTNAYIGMKDHETASNNSAYVGLVHKF